MRKIVRMFDKGNVCVVGMRGNGKDMLMGNVIARRHLPYISNTNYGYQYHKFKPDELLCGGNSWREFMREDVRYYEWAYPDGTDIYIADAGVYIPAQYCGELNKEFAGIPTFMALSRHLGASNVHVNCQNLNRIWDKVREQSDTYIMCNYCKVFFGKVVFQIVTIYELHDSAVKRVPPFRLPRPWFNPERMFNWQIQKQNYMISHGNIKRRCLLYWNKAHYDTRLFKEVLRNGKKIPKESPKVRK